MSSKKKYVTLFIEQKKELYLKKANNPSISNIKLAKYYINNTPTHEKEDEISSFSNIELYYLPPNITVHLQPLDTGIINSFKAKYQKLLVENRVEEYDFA